MLNFLQNYNPSPILFSFGPAHIYWYGFFIVLGIVAALLVTVWLSKYFSISSDTIIDLSFWLIIWGIVGARIYHVFLEWSYYSTHPLNIIKLWQGGLAIHGAIFAGIIVIWLFIRKSKIDFFQLAALVVPGLALGQAIGRWGNYFNQELFGYPTDLPWGIFIDQANRPLEYYSNHFFHPTFLYESAGSLVIFFVLLVIIYLTNDKLRKKMPKILNPNFPATAGPRQGGGKFQSKFKLSNNQVIVFSYLIMYSILRFSLEFVRIDSTPAFLGLRFPQWVSLGIIIVCVYFCVKKSRNNNSSVETCHGASLQK